MPRPATSRKEFDTTLRDGGGRIVFDFDVRAVFGKVRFPAKVTIDGVVLRTTIFHMGGEYCVVVRREIREAVGKGEGDRVHVVVEQDTEERTVAAPPAFVAALRKAGLRERFGALSYTHRKEYVQWIAEAKREETRARRLAKAVALLKAGKKGPR